MAAEAVTEITSTAQWEKVLAESGSKVIVIDFHATWCGPCKRIKPRYQELASSNPGAVFVSVDVDDVEDLAEKFAVEAMPTFVFVRSTGDGKYEKLGEFLGADGEKLKAKFESLTAGK
jgi:thioredoxin 1